MEERERDGLAEKRIEKMGITYQDRGRENIQTAMENQNCSNQNWDISRDITSDKITQLRQFQTDNSEMQKTSPEKKSYLLFDCPKFL